MPTFLAPRRTHKVNMKIFRINIYFAFKKKQNPTQDLTILEGIGMFPSALRFYKKEEILDTKTPVSEVSFCVVK